MGILEAINWAIIALNAVGLLLSIPAAPPEHPVPPQQQEIKYDSSTHESPLKPDAP